MNLLEATYFTVSLSTALPAINTEKSDIIKSSQFNHFDDFDVIEKEDD
jgi:hypothetical protein